MTLRVVESVGRRGVYGRVGLGRYDVRTGLYLPKPPKFNQIQDGWMFAAAQALGGVPGYHPSAMYIEFENVGDPDDPVTVPAFDTTEGIEYYDELAFSPSRDYLRVALNQRPLLGVEDGYEQVFAAGQGNKLTFFALSVGAVGTHGKEYSDAVNSKVFGVALVATPEFSDHTQDIVFSRTYFPADEQVVKEVSHQVGVTWDIVFLRP
jgi:hypothetical protein